MRAFNLAFITCLLASASEAAPIKSANQSYSSTANATATSISSSTRTAKQKRPTSSATAIVASSSSSHPANTAHKDGLNDYEPLEYAGLGFGAAAALAAVAYWRYRTNGQSTTVQQASEKIPLPLDDDEILTEAERLRSVLKLKVKVAVERKFGIMQRAFDAKYPEPENAGFRQTLADSIAVGKEAERKVYMSEKAAFINALDQNPAMLMFEDPEIVDIYVEGAYQKLRNKFLGNWDTDRNIANIDREVDTKIWAYYHAKLENARNDGAPQSEVDALQNMVDFQAKTMEKSEDTLEEVMASTAPIGELDVSGNPSRESAPVQENLDQAELVQSVDKETDALLKETVAEADVAVKEAPKVLDVAAADLSRLPAILKTA